ncbi:MAG TPA: hypothetical protein VEZ46_05590 [Mycobacteriales bacterium]|nr:hypothetical protein [Mycobacteriales bacterium]
MSGDAVRDTQRFRTADTSGTGAHTASANSAAAAVFREPPHTRQSSTWRAIRLRHNVE